MLQLRILWYVSLSGLSESWIPSLSAPLFFPRKQYKHGAFLAPNRNNPSKLLGYLLSGPQAWRATHHDDNYDDHDHENKTKYEMYSHDRNHNDNYHQSDNDDDNLEFEMNTSPISTPTITTIPTTSSTISTPTTLPISTEPVPNLDSSTHGTTLLTLPLADVQTLSSNLSYFYLKNELGLGEETMWKITYDAGSVLGMTADTIRRKVDVLRGLMDLSDPDLRTIIERQPSVLQLSADKNISPTILNLLRSLDLARDELRALIVSCPAILTYSKANLKAKIRFFTLILGLSIEECRTLFLREPNLLKAGVSTGLFPRTRFLLRDIQIPIADLRCIALRHPRILLYSLEHNLIPKLIYYCMLTIRLEPSQVTRLLKSYPEFMGYNLERHILPITRYFLQELDFSTPEFQKVLLNYPRLMTNSLTKIKHCVGYLRFETGLCAEQVRRVLYQAPSLLGLNTDGSVRDKVAFLRNTLELEEDEDWKCLLTGMPNILLLRIEGNLKPKLNYLLDAFDGDLDELREALLRLPTLLGYSLEHRIIPRMQAIKDAGISDPGSITVGIPMKEERFQKWLQGRQNKLLRNRLSSVPSEDTALVMIDEKKEEATNPSGRIVHWTRERRKQRTNQ